LQIVFWTQASILNSVRIAFQAQMSGALARTLIIVLIFLNVWRFS